MSCTRGTVDLGPLAGSPRVVISCDHDGCRASRAIAPAATFSYARMFAARARWRHVLLKRRQGGPSASVDLCPEHAAVPVEQIPQPLSPHWRAKRRSA